MVIPLPGFWIDGFANTAQQAQGCARRGGDKLIALSHQSSQCSGCCIENINLVFVDYLPAAASIRVSGYALEHQCGRTVGEGAIDNISVASDPADIRGTPINIAIVIVEDVLVGHGSLEHITASWPNNMPMMLAALGVFYRNFMDVGSHAILPYDHSLRLLPAHLQQLDMESNGKSVSVEGDLVPIQTGPTIWGGEGTNGQHAFHQLLHQGTQFTSLDFILPLTPHHDRQLHHDWLVANCLSQSQALLQGQNIDQLKFEGAASEKMPRVMPGNRPSNTIVMDQLTPETLGATIALYEHKVFCQAQIWQINPFDQWGVELGKKLSETIFEAIDQGAEPTLDPSTRELLSRYQQTRKVRSH